MHLHARSLVVALLVVGLAAAGGEAAKLRVVATIPDLKALTEAVGGEAVDVDSLARGTQNPHDLEVRPSLMVKVRRADALVVNGLELDNWVDLVIRGANNGRIVPGSPGFIDASRGVQVLDVPTGRVDRSMGDVHPLGDPHYTFDPGQAPTVTATILEGLGRLAPDRRAAFERNREVFLQRLEGAMARWRQALEPVRGAHVVTYHKNFAYLFNRFGLVQAGTIEERPGIPPSPAHLARLVGVMRERRVKVVVAERWSDQRLAARIAEEAGARVVLLNRKLGEGSGADAYLASVDANVTALAQALR